MSLKNIAIPGFLFAELKAIFVSSASIVSVKIELEIEYVVKNCKYMWEY